jgi:eukaryotic-like serine/threonine-protein kinase
VLGPHSMASGVFAGAAAAALVLASSSVGWLLVALAAVGWLGASGQPGSALVLFAALAPVPVLLPSRPWLWSMPALGPVLGVLGIAACAPVLAGRLGGRAASRAALGALCYWWLAIAETLTGRRLLLGVATGVKPRDSWQASLTGAFHHALAPLWSDGRLVTAAVWAFAAMLLPWLVRGRSRELRAVAALAWAGSLILVGALVATRLGAPRPPFPLAVGVLATVLAFGTAGRHHRPHQSANVA